MILYDCLKILKESVVAFVKVLSQIFAKILRKTTKTSYQDKPTVIGTVHLPSAFYSAAVTPTRSAEGFHIASFLEPDFV